MLKKLLLATLILSLLTYVFGYLDYPYICTAAIIFTFYAGVISIFWACVSLAFPKTTDDLRKKKIRLIPVAVISLILFKLISWAVNGYYLPPAVSDMRFVIKIFIFAITLIIAMHLVTGRRKTIMFTLSILFVIASVIAPFISPSKPDSHKTAKPKPNLKTINTIPYVDIATGDKDIETGIVIHNREKVFEGFNLWYPLGSSKARLSDLQGNTLHEWFPGNPRRNWRADVVLCENGDLLGINNIGHLLRVDWDSKVKWERTDLDCHHEIAVAESGEIYVLNKKPRVIFLAGLPLPIRDDLIVILSQDGDSKDKISMLDAVHEDIALNSIAGTYWYMVQPGTIKKMIKDHLMMLRGEATNSFLTPAEGIFDNLHTNTVSIINRQVDGLCKKGDLLVCLRNWDMIGFMDPKKKTLIWQWNAGQASRPHTPSLLENNNILLFDNGPLRKYSKVVEMNPFTGKIVWEYIADPPESFHSRVRGCSQQLPNGNILITESDKGRVFEITPDGEVVWDFYNPEKSTKNNEQRAAIYRMQRIIEPNKYSCLERLK